jgi:hypothetical protein
MNALSSSGPVPGNPRSRFLPPEVCRLLDAFAHDIRSNNNVAALSVRMVESEINTTDQDILADLAYIRKGIESVSRLVDVLHSLSREEWKPGPLSSQTLVDMNDKLMGLTEFQFDVVIGNLDTSNDMAIYLDGFFNMTLLILQDILSFIGRLPAPRLALNYTVNGSRLEVSALLPLVPGSETLEPIRHELPKLVVDAFRGTLDCCRNPEHWQVTWTFPLDE